MKEISLVVPEEFKKNVVRALKSAKDHSYSDARHAVGLEGVYQNSRNIWAWDALYTAFGNVAKRMEGFVEILGKRGFWEFPMSFDTTRKQLYILMKEENLHNVCLDYGKNKGKAHYAQALFSVNNFCTDGEINVSKIGVQGSIFEYLDEGGMSEFQSNRERVLREVLGEYYGEVEQVVVVRFKCLRGEVLRVGAALIDSEMNGVDHQNWSDYLQDDPSEAFDRKFEYEGEGDEDDTFEPLVAFK